MNTECLGLVERLRAGGQPDLADMAERLLNATQKLHRVVCDMDLFIEGQRPTEEEYEAAVREAGEAIVAASGAPFYVGSEG